MGVCPETWRAWREFNRVGVPDAPPGGLLELIAGVVARYPARPAVQGTDGTLSYRELDQRADRVAAVLRGAGVAAGSVVAITAGDSTHPYAGILGVLKAGCAYLPINAADPPGRLRFMVRDAEAAALLSLANEVPKLATLGMEHLPCAVLEGPSPAAGWRELGPATASAMGTGGSTAYVIYTSGTTGNPKGVRIGHDALLNFVRWFTRRHDVRPTDRLAQVAPLTFDPSVQQIFPAWAAGACLIAVPGAELRDPRALLDWLATERISHLDLVTSHWHHLRESAAALSERCHLPDLRWIVIGGETMHYHESHRWYSVIDSPARLNNIYGPTEATINATEWEVEATQTRGQVPIGVPLPNYQLYVVSPEGLRPPGETGELLIAGTGLAERYQSAEATARAFGCLDLPDGTCERIYRSGDLARLVADESGQWVLEFCGRTDAQVKIHGYRVELEEVEAAAKTCPGVTAVAVLARGEPVEQLVCFSTGPSPVADGLMREHLAGLIPEYMVPNLYLWLPQFPVTRNGKLDSAELRAALDTHLAGRPSDADGTAGTPAEVAVTRAWAQVLGLPRVGVDEDFFGLGGTSLLAAAAVNVLRRKGWRGNVTDLYRAPTARAFASQLAMDGHPEVAEGSR